MVRRSYDSGAKASLVGRCVQALHAEAVPFHEEDLLPQLDRADRGGVATGSRADHEDLGMARHGRAEGPRFPYLSA